MGSLRAWLIGALGGLAGLLGLATWISKFRKDKLDRKTRKKLDHAIYKAGQVEQQRQTVLSYVQEDDSAIMELDKHLLEAKREAVSIVQKVEEMSHEQIEERFKALGY